MFLRLGNTGVVTSRLLLSLLFVIAPVAVFSAEAEWQDVDRIVVVGDVHGDYTNFQAVLRDAGMINRRGNWTGGATHLVQLGDLPDRGPDTAQVIALLKKLEAQAERDGGKVHVLIGNHEAMNMLGDLRYVHEGEYAAFRSRNSRRIRDDYYEVDIARRQTLDPTFQPDANFRERWEQAIPLGMIEHQYAWSPAGEIGSWVLEHNAVIKINRNLFMHGGISPAVAGQGIAAINAQIRSDLRGETVVQEQTGAEQLALATLAESENGPLWYRGLAANAEHTELGHVNQVLATYDVDRIIIGHTPGMGTVVPRFEGKVLIADVGLAAYYGGNRASLEIEQGKAFTRHGDERVPIPESAADLLGYYQRIAEIAPANPAIQAQIQRLQQP